MDAQRGQRVVARLLEREREAAHDQVRRVAGQVRGALALARHDERGHVTAHGHVVVHVQGHAQAVEPRAHVGGGRGHAHRDAAAQVPLG